MAERIYLHFLILCGILSQGIVATSDEDSRESSDLLVRKRRVINHLPGGQTPTPIDQAKYIVNLKINNRVSCVGSILSHYTVITAASCFHEHENLTHYKILSGSAYDISSNVHEVTSKSVYYGNPPHQTYDGIALITVDPPFVYSRTTGFIHLYQRPLPAGTMVTVRGWGCAYPPRPGPPGLRRRLRSITLPIMNHRECQNEYRIFYRITEKYVCTNDQNQYCARTDTGTPLIVNNKLAGIYVWKGERSLGKNPEIYVDLHLPDYIAWIRENTILM